MQRAVELPPAQQEETRSECCRRDLADDLSVCSRATRPRDDRPVNSAVNLLPPTGEYGRAAESDFGNSMTSEELLSQSQSVKEALVPPGHNNHLHGEAPMWENCGAAPTAIKKPDDLERTYGTAMEEIKEDVKESIAVRESIEAKSEPRKLVPADWKESEAEDRMLEYLARIPSQLQTTFASARDVVKRTKASSEGYWLRPAETEGLAVFCMESGFGQRRASILHVSTVDPMRTSELVAAVVEHIWKNVNCGEIRAELRYAQQGSTYAPYEPIKLSLMKDNGFRWKTLLNESAKTGGQRVLVVGLARPASSVFANPRGIEVDANAIRLRHATVLDIGETSASSCKPEEKTEPAVRLLGYCSGIEALRQSDRDEELSAEEQNPISHLGKLLGLTLQFKQKKVLFRERKIGHTLRCQGPALRGQFGSHQYIPAGSEAGPRPSSLLIPRSCTNELRKQYDSSHAECRVWDWIGHPERLRNTQDTAIPG